MCGACTRDCLIGCDNTAGPAGLVPCQFGFLCDDRLTNVNLLHADLGSPGTRGGLTDPLVA
jgi:hypothetical protein